MLTKPSPDAIKMLHSIEEFFNKAFDDNKYTCPSLTFPHLTFASLNSSKQMRSRSVFARKKEKV